LVDSSFLRVFSFIHFLLRGKRFELVLFRDQRIFVILSETQEISNQIFPFGIFFPFVKDWGAVATIDVFSDSDGRLAICCGSGK
jgi:hypothetical protein